MERGTKRTLNTDERIDEAISVFEDVIKSLNDIKEKGMSIKTACTNHDLDWTKVRSIINTAANIRNSVWLDIAEIISVKNPYEELYKDLFRLRNNIEYNKVKLPYDYEDAVNWAMNKVLDDREKAVLDRRYGLTSGESETLETIGNDIGLSNDRIRQIGETALRKLRRTCCRTVLTLGLKAANHKQALQENLQKTNLKNIEDEFKTLVDEEQNRHANTLQQIASNTYTETLKTVCESIRIGDLNITVRAYNCLLRANITNLYDLLRYDENQLRKVRNLGQSSLKEILYVLEATINERFNMTISEARAIVRDNYYTECIQNSDYTSLCKEIPIDELLSEGLIKTSQCNALKRSHVNTVYDFLIEEKNTVVRFRNFSYNSYVEVMYAISVISKERFKMDAESLRAILLEQNKIN